MEHSTPESNNPNIGKTFEGDNGEIVKISRVVVSSRNLARIAISECGQSFLVSRPGLLINMETEESYREITR